MKRAQSIIAVLVAASLVAIPAAASAQTPPPATLESVEPAIDAIFARWMADNHVPGMVFGVVDHGHLVYVRGMGVQDTVSRRAVDADTLFRIASMTKAFTALSILSLRDKGLLNLDDPAEKYVPEMRGWGNATADSPRITIRDLLHHVAGFVTDDPWGDRQTTLPQDQFSRLLAAGVPFARAPEMRHEYANLGYAILGRVIANVTHAPYRAYVESTLLGPLGMTASGYDVHALPQDRRALGYRWENERWTEEPTMDDGAFNSMGGLSVSARDYGKWLAFLVSAWPPRDAADTGPVRRGTVRQIAQGLNFQSVFHRYGASGATACPGALAYGMGWRVVQDCELGLTLNHGGGYPGYGSHVLLLPEFGVALFALTNKSYAGPNAPVWDSAVLMLHQGLLKRPVPVISPDLAAFYASAREVWAKGSVAPLAGKVAVNFAMDRSDAQWGKVLAETRASAGPCATDAPINPDHAMSGTFTWTCAHGTIEGAVLLAPTRPITLQALRFGFVPAP
ncbi:serine hydrolase domain-containing protein [Novosphingobium acidiphilum]|uniref:serine hydrolase domain-containing protein n=1 Tax=Novosphingobium acidiphilum TaxID=505248 RepID=UPI00042A3DF6|nr:serine hydrolase domain-containing protein [Novosphingobium acidiphilum]